MKIFKLILCSTILITLTLIFSTRESEATIQGNGITTRISVSSDGVEGNDLSQDTAISANGRYIVFYSIASNLVNNDTNGWSDVFVHDRLTGQTTRVSVASDGSEGNNASGYGKPYYSSISADGRFVAFVSAASNLVSNDFNNNKDVFVHDCLTGETKRVSESTDGIEGTIESYYVSLSADGHYVAFVSRNKFTPGNPVWDVEQLYIHNISTNETNYIDVSYNGKGANYRIEEPSISGDGRYIAFSSKATNLIPGHVGYDKHIYVYDILSKQINQIDKTSFPSDSPHISTDGCYVVFHTVDCGIIDICSGLQSIFLWDILDSKTTRIAVASDGTRANMDSIDPSISADGRYISFRTWADNLVDDDHNGKSDVFVHDTHSGKTIRVSVSSNGLEGNDDSDRSSISPDGGYVSFYSSASNLVDNDNNGVDDAFVHDWTATQYPYKIFLSIITQMNP